MRWRTRAPGLIVMLAVAVSRPSFAQERTRPSLILYEPMTIGHWSWSAPAPEETGGVMIDVGARFEAFQRQLAEDFGAPFAGEDDEAEERVGEALVERWEGSRLFRWYERLVGVYDRFEGVYQRLERSTRWATSDFSIDPDLEAAVDGKLRVSLEREVAGFDMGLRVDDAIDGRLGVRLGGVIRGYKFGFGVSDMMNEGRFSLQVRKTAK